MKKISKIHTLCYAILLAFTICSCSSCFDDDKQVVTLPQELTYVNIEMLVFSPIQQNALMDTLAGAIKPFLQEDSNHGVVPILTLKNAAKPASVFSITRRLTENDNNMTGDIKNATFVKMVNRETILPSIKVPKVFSDSFSVSPEILLRYQEGIKKEEKKGDKAIILFNTNLEDETKNTVHSVDSLTLKITEYIAAGKRDIKIYYNMTTLNPIVIGTIMETQLEKKQERANGMKSTTERMEALAQIDADLDAKLNIDNQKANLWYLRAVNRAYAGDHRAGIKYLENAVRVSIPDSASYMNTKITFDEGTRLRFLVSNQTSKFKTLKNALSKEDVNLIGVIMKHPESQGNEEYCINLNSSDDSYRNTLKGYTISTSGKDELNNVNINIAVPEGINKTLRVISFSSLPYGKPQSASYDNGNWNYMISNESPSGVNYVRLRFSFKKSIPLPIPIEEEEK